MTCHTHGSHCRIDIHKYIHTYIQTNIHTYIHTYIQILTLILNINSRANEFAADQYAKDLGMATALGSGLVKISVENLGNMVPDGLYSMYHFSHPPLVERLAAINTKKLA
jgi:Zn-dependent protease with chaperone function